MPRKGKALETLVVQLETALGATTVKTTSPDYIRGKLTGSNREIDISLRATIGSADVLVIVECRDRDGTEDCTWIEQLATKTEDVGADKAIAVSTDGFSEGAQNLAKAKNIELRTVSEIDKGIVATWFSPAEMEVEVLRVNFDVFDVVAKHTAPPPPLPVDAKFYFAEQETGKTIEGLDIWKLAVNANVLSGGVLANAPKERRQGTLRFEKLDVVVGEYRWPLSEIAFVASVWIESSTVPFTFKSYDSHTDNLAQIVGTKTQIGNSLFGINFVRDSKTGDLRMIVRETKSSKSEQS